VQDEANGIGVDGKPSHDRNWQECFAQLVGTVLSLWDAAELDAAKPGEEVVPTFLNLTDASIKMVGIWHFPSMQAGERQGTGRSKVSQALSLVCICLSKESLTDGI
jgi:hypothetical protein